MEDTRVFALYKGDTYIMDGTIREIAKARGCTVRSIKFLLTEAYRKRMEQREANRKKPSKGCLTMIYLDEGTWGYGWKANKDGLHGILEIKDGHCADGRN